jgi:GT2 family glycosyltransferase/glycosyltransferase involved in cell wall biosynthesis
MVAGNPGGDSERWFLASIAEGSVILVEDENGVLDGDLPRAAVELRIDGEPVALCEPGAGHGVDPLLGINQLRNSDLEDGLQCWDVRPGEHTKGLRAGVDRNEAWSIKEVRTGYLRAKRAASIDELVYADPIDGEFIPIRGDQRFAASGYFATRRCQGELTVQFFDQAMCLLGEVTQSIGKARGGRKLKRYAHTAVAGVSPGVARFARLLVRKLPTASGEDSYLFFARLWFGYADSDVQSQWSPPPLAADVVSWLRRRGPACRISRIPLPAGCFDGETHTIEAIDRASGRQINGSPQRFRAHPDVTGAVQALAGTSVVGWIQARDNDPVGLTLYIDGAKVTTGLSDWYGERRQDFRLPIPPVWLDGLPHLVTVKVMETGKVLGELAGVLPSVSTHWSTLQQYAGPNTPAWLAPAAGRRYENLRRWLASSVCLDREQWSERFAQLGQTHEILVQGINGTWDFAPLGFPCVNDPLVSVIIPVHDQFAITYSCLAALSFAYNRTPFEVIVVDDGSTDETRVLPELISGVSYVRNETARGFVRACNLGASKARGRYVVFLNNDTEPAGRWLDELLFVFDAFDDVGIAGSKLVYPNGRLQDAGGIVWNSGNPWIYGRDGNPEEPKYNYTRQVDYLTGASIMLPRDLWDAVGGFSEEFCPAYFEDTDLAFKVRAMGKRVVYAPLSVVYHYEGMSRKFGDDLDVKIFQEINRPIFKDKWIDAYTSHGEEGRDLELVKDRNVQYRVLMIDYMAPRPEYDAGSYAAIQEIRLLQSLGCKITFLPLDLRYLGDQTLILQRLGVECLYAPFVTSIEDLLAERGAEFDVVYITRYTVARQVIRAVRRHASRAKVLFCNADLHFLRTLRAALADKDPDTLEAAIYIRDAEMEVMRKVDVVLSYNTTEHAIILSHNLGSTKTVTAPWVVEVKDDVPPFEARRDIAFLGAFRHPPNLQAVKFFIMEVMPLLRQRLPGVRFRVYGSDAPEELTALESEDVLIEGYVQDVSEVYDTCRVFVAPLLAGAGLKGKVIESLAHGAPSVLSPVAAEGTGLRHGLETFVAETPEQWATMITALYQDPQVWQEISTQARAYARAAYSFEHGRELMAKAMEAAGLSGVYPPTPSEALVSRTARSKI